MQLPPVLYNLPVILIRNASKGKRVVRMLGLFLLCTAALLVAGWFVLDQMQGQWLLAARGPILGAAIAQLGGVSTWLNYYFGDRGEEGLIQKLELLGDEYTVITNWQPPNEKRGDVDIIVLGPHGVAALECKRYSSEFGCDGDFWFLKMENGYKKKIKSLSSQTRGHAQCIKRHLKRQGVEATIPLPGQGEVRRGSTGVHVHTALVFNSLRRASISNPKVRVIDYEDAVDFIYSLPRTGATLAEVFQD